MSAVGQCRCGCRQTVNLGRCYRQGHDRRHVESYVRWWQGTNPDRNSRESIDAKARGDLSLALYREFRRRTGQP